MNPPPPELSWISVATALVGGLSGVLALLDRWRKRSRLHFRIVNAESYRHLWTESDVEWAHREKPHWHTWVPVKAGQCRKAFTVIEFAVRNGYPRSVSVGRFVINDWIFSDHYTPQMYDRRRDYRVHDLYSRKPAGLDEYRKLEPGDVFGLRVEILEESDGPIFVSNHHYHHVETPRTFEVRYLTDIRPEKHRVRLRRVVEEGYEGVFYAVYRWSELLGPESPGGGGAGAARPQGVPTPRSWRVPTRQRVRQWRSLAANYLLYGTRYPMPEQPSRFGRIAARLGTLRLAGKSSGRRSR